MAAERLLVTQVDIDVMALLRTQHYAARLEVFVAEHFLYRGQAERLFVRQLGLQTGQDEIRSGGAEAP